MTEALRARPVRSEPVAPHDPRTPTGPERLRRSGAIVRADGVGAPGTVLKAGGRAAAGTKAAEVRRPYHVGVFLGLSAGLYAVSLAGVTALQSSSDRAVTDARQPTVAALDAMRAGHDALDARVVAGGTAYQAAADGYQRAAETLGALERELDALATAVGKVDGVASNLPTHVALPSLPRSAPAVVSAAPPAVHATTGASGKP